MKTLVHFKYNIEMDLDFYVRVRRCKKRVTGTQPEEAEEFKYVNLEKYRMKCFSLNSNPSMTKVSIFNNVQLITEVTEPFYF